MRADRLLSMLMLLQARGRMTARQLAGELEVSERTIYRDLQALSTAGVPVFAERGPGGGCALIESYRTNLTGLSEDEVRALFMLSIPTPLADLGIGQEFRAAMLKLAAALPASQRQAEARARQCIHLDWQAWGHTGSPAPFLPILYQAVWGDRRLWLKYRMERGTMVERLIDPYGLVAKGGKWYLVLSRDRHLRVLPVERVVEARISDETFQRPEQFVIGQFWEKWCADHQENRPYYPVRARIAPHLLPLLKYIFAESAEEIIASAGPPNENGWVIVILPFESFEAARARMLSLGRAAEVLEPLALRRSVVDYAQQILAYYTHRE